ncbi:hypothetical protein EYF80_011073 [Liparis tanakae]|uniref:Uncharacterized protein n=1 Tax=Liparis tanakae TaxID=230148 RepID=A0A4Z2IKX6_9TELE|nr:hypothetical protein EYF80_011073 [Liparis tanakae]
MEKPQETCSKEVGQKVVPAPLLTDQRLPGDEETRVKTVGFLVALQAEDDTKLVTPWTTHLPFTLQFRGPPESPWTQRKQAKPSEDNKDTLSAH